VELSTVFKILKITTFRRVALSSSTGKTQGSWRGGGDAHSVGLVRWTYSSSLRIKHHLTSRFLLGCDAV